jgi:C-terminal processing protease CtpA/Prc
MLSSDYDYNMAYGGAGDIQSISTAGGMKSAIVSKPLYYPKVAQGPYDVSRQSSISSKNSDPSVSMKETLTLYSDDNSFERQYNQPDDRIEVMAPAGKLGIVIDTPNGGIPMVHAIKESSILIDQVKVGDRLIMVDGIDTTSMSAIKVSRLISTRSDNPRRVLVFLRYRTED